MTQWKVEARLSFEEVYGNSENYHDVMMLLRRKLIEARKDFTGIEK